MCRFASVKQHQNPFYSKVHVHTKSRIYFVQSFTITNAKVTDDTIASLIKLTYNGYNIPIVKIS